MNELIGSIYDFQTMMAGIFFVLPRVYVMLLVIPMFSDKVISGMVRSGMATVIAVFAYPTVMPDLQNSSLFQGLGWLVILIKEGFIGLLLGFIGSIFFWVMEGIGQLVDQQTGSSNAAVFDPLSGHETGPTSGFLLQLTIVLFASSGGLLMLLGALFESYNIWPILKAMPLKLELVRAFAVNQTDTLLALTVKLAAPIITVLLLIEYGLGLMARSAQQLNVFSLSQPIKSSAAIIIMALMLSHVLDSMVRFLSDSDRLVQLFKILGN